MRLAIGLVLCCVAAPTASGAVIAEDFNYGTTNAAITSFGSAGGGWGGGWTSSGANVFYNADVNLSFSDANYNNAGNSADTGSVFEGGADNEGVIATRPFASALAGTVWISALVQPTNDALLWVQPARGATEVFLGIRASDAFFEYANDGGTTALADQFVDGQTYLMLTRIDINSSGDNDAVSLWLFDNDAGTTQIPSLPATEAGLPAPLLTKATADVLGSGLSQIGISFDNGDVMDAIRISNDADGYHQVIQVPEPSGVAAILAGGLLIGRRRLGSLRHSRSGH